MLEVDFLNLCAYGQTQKYTGNRFFKLIYSFQTQKYTGSKLSKFMYLSSNSEVDMFIKKRPIFDGTLEVVF